MSTRAKRLRKALDDFGCETGDSGEQLRACHKCDSLADTADKYCRHCGTKLKPHSIPKEGSTIWQLEQALKYALKEADELR